MIGYQHAVNWIVHRQVVERVSDSEMRAHEHMTSLGRRGVDTIEKLAQVKSVLVEAVPRAGFAVLNAQTFEVEGRWENGGGKQVGRNQTFGADVNRSGIPRRTGG